MEQRVSAKVSDHMIHFKQDVEKWMKHFDIKVMREDEDMTAVFLQYLYSYEDPKFTDEDFQKRKRTAVVVPSGERCIAKRSNSEQCSRRRKNGGCFCGTHVKGNPYGVVTQAAEEETVRKIEIRTVEINGIYYYIDDNNNIYSPEEIINEVSKPTIIGIYQDGKYIAY